MLTWVVDGVPQRNAASCRSLATPDRTAARGPADPRDGPGRRLRTVAVLLALSAPGALAIGRAVPVWRSDRHSGRDDPRLHRTRCRAGHRPHAAGLVARRLAATCRHGCRAAAGATDRVSLPCRVDQ